MGVTSLDVTELVLRLQKTMQTGSREAQRAGIQAGAIVRFSIGLEHMGDLRADLAQALAAFSAQA